LAWQRAPVQSVEVDELDEVDEARFAVVDSVEASAAPFDLATVVNGIKGENIYMQFSFYS